MYSQNEKNQTYPKDKNSVGMQKIEERNKQFLVEKIIHAVEFANPYENSVEKKPEIIDTVESNYRIMRTVFRAFIQTLQTFFLNMFIL